MTTILPVQCLACSRLDRSTVVSGGTVVPNACTAYPDGIPTDIATYGADHRQPRGDELGGQTFALADGGEEAFAAWTLAFGPTAS